MRYFVFPFILALLLLTACGNPIKDEAAVVEVEEGTEVSSPAPALPADPTPTPEVVDNNVAPIGFWVGDFRRPNDIEDEKTITSDVIIFWNRSNKINISIDAIRGDSVFGHSVVAGNDRPFAGLVIRAENGTTYSVREPGDDRYDGAFEFQIVDNQLIGTWSAYKDIDIKNRRYTLARRTFSYNPNTQLEEAGQYIDWTNSKKEPIQGIDGNTEEWMLEHFAASTELIYTLNASAQRLTKAQVENLKKGDLTIIRNTIYARHGYSFKNRPLRVFFDAQPWYIPVHADIKADFTEIEKENIQLLLKYEKNAAEFYDYFGRG